jgi:hypothetical protein
MVPVIFISYMPTLVTSEVLTVKTLVDVEKVKTDESIIPPARKVQAYVNTSQAVTPVVKALTVRLYVLPPVK